MSVALIIKLKVHLYWDKIMSITFKGKGKGIRQRVRIYWHERGNKSVVCNKISGTVIIILMINFDCYLHIYIQEVGIGIRRSDHLLALKGRIKVRFVTKCLWHLKINSSFVLAQVNALSLAVFLHPKGGRNGIRKIVRRYWN